MNFSNQSKRITWRFALPLLPAGFRTGKGTSRLRRLASYIYFQTTDQDGMVFPTARPDWISETECQGSFFRSDLTPRPAFDRVKQFIGTYTLPGKVDWHQS
jgi:hypothetical protein